MYPGAYDRPNDDIDQDCDGEDRILDGVVLDEGGYATWEVTISLPGNGLFDVGVLLDTTCSMSSALSTLDFTEIDATLGSIEGADIQYAFSTFDDYPYGSMGSRGYDLPFQLHQQVTDDVAAVQHAVDGASIHSGGDGPEAAIEALYQALTGAGYDLGCDGSYDSDEDVLPFLASASDPFAGAGGEGFDADSSGGGTLGGLGFRDLSTPIIVYVTDNTMRDPDGLTDGPTESPGGCPFDGSSDGVLDAADTLGAWLGGVSYATLANAGMIALSDAGGWEGDFGSGMEPLYVEVDDLNSSITAIVQAVIDQVGTEVTYSAVSLDPVVDAYGLVVDIDPDPAEDISTADSSELTFSVTLYGGVPAYVEPLEVRITFEVMADGESLGTTTLDVEIPPA